MSECERAITQPAANDPGHLRCATPIISSVTRKSRPRRSAETDKRHDSPARHSQVPAAVPSSMPWPRMDQSAVRSRPQFSKPKCALSDEPEPANAPLHTQNEDLIKKALQDMNALSTQQLTELVNAICQRATQGTQNAEPAVQFCLFLIAVDCLRSVLTRTGKVIEHFNPDLMEALVWRMRESYLEHGFSSITGKHLLHLIELRASGWKMNIGQQKYYDSTVL
ncbi:hypothetical protein V5799_032021 [Amblyomma americanum]|uniref:Mif4g domain-containing protein n=1 Tax=Amblyomma americanum TaxID=6943 RepID=A0AAQ4DSC8_AMBAM